MFVSLRPDFGTEFCMTFPNHFESLHPFKTIAKTSFSIEVEQNVGDLVNLTTFFFLNQFSMMFCCYHKYLSKIMYFKSGKIISKRNRLKQTNQKLTGN